MAPPTSMSAVSSSMQRFIPRTSWARLGRDALLTSGPAPTGLVLSKGSNGLPAKAEGHKSAFGGCQKWPGLRRVAASTGSAIHALPHSERAEGGNGDKPVASNPSAGHV
jgi:hypothetical protein